MKKSEIKIGHMDELFLPKLVDQNERTLYEAFQTGRLMLEDGTGEN